jgi:hypothetical protein
MPWFTVAFAIVALAAGALAPVAGAGSPSQDQYGQPLPGVGGNDGGASDTSGSSSTGTGESTIPVAGSDGQGTQGSGSESNGGDSSSSGSSKGESSHKSDGGSSASTPTTDVNSADNTAHSVPQIAADSAGDSWVPFFIAALVALGACGAALVYRNRRRAAHH